MFNYFDYDGENQFISIVANQNCSRIVIHRPYKYLLCTGGLTIFNSETKQVTKIAVSGLENAKTKNRADNYNLLADLLVYEGQNKKMSALIAFQTNLDQGLKIYSLSDLHGTPVISSPQVRKNLPQGEVKIFSNLSYKTSEQQIEFDVLVLENSQPDISFNWHIFDHYRPGNDFSLITPRVLNMDKTSLANCQTDGVFIGDLFATGCTNPQNSNYHNLYSLSEVDSTSHLRKLIAVNNGGLSEQTIVTPMMGTQNSLPAVVIINYKGQYVFFNN